VAVAAAAEVAAAAAGAAVAVAGAAAGAAVATERPDASTCPMIDGIHRQQLPSGVRIVTEAMPSVRSVSIGCWVSVGSRDEPAEMAGASHFLEHLLFKGTADRSARRIAEEVDALGGEMNAFTSKEFTAYYLRLPDTAFDWGVELLGQILSEPALRADDVDAEREVIIEELLMNLDDPDDRVHTMLIESLFPDHPVGREVLGEPDTVRAMSRDSIAAFHASHYGPANLVVAVAGNVDHEQVVAAVERGVGGAPQSVRPERNQPDRPLVPRRVETRPLEQAHVSIGWRALDHHDPDRYALAVVNQILGGGMSSRLFQEVREQRGLAYSVYSSPSALSDCGALSVYVGTAPDRLEVTAEVVAEVVAELGADGVTAQELEVAKGFLAGSLVLGLEDSASRMSRLGSGEAIRGEVVPIDEHIRRIEAVGLDDAARVAARVLEGARTVAAVGPFDDDHAAFAVLAGS
jgi:predicted Zn-dependent peptidase